MASSLTESQAQIIKATVPVLADYGLAITTRFYHDLLEAHPSLKNIFNNTHQATGHQAQALAGALYAYAANIDALGNLSPALELICHKHVSLFIKAEHYELVGKHLLETMKAVLGDACTPDILDAWGAAYWQLANIMINKEQELYDTVDGWTEWKDFKVTKKEKESEEVTSFYLEPVDEHMKLPVFRPGQYISVNMWVDEIDGGVWQARQYSLSDAPGKRYFRISVKREEGVVIGEEKSKTHPGYLSNILHEKVNVGGVVRVSHPFGDFYFEEQEQEKDTPVVLISAGVGLTCLLSILNSLVEQQSTRPVSWIQAARNSDARAFKSHVDELAASHENLHAVYFSSMPKESEVQGNDYDIKGRLDLDKVSKDDLFVDRVKTQYFVCGPNTFMADIEKKLKTYGVPAERIRMELFGTGGVPRV